LEIEGGVISSLVQQAIPAEAGGDYAMTSHSTMPEQLQSQSETAVHLFDNWFDPIEAGLRDRAREFLQAMLETELDEVLDRSRYAWQVKRSAGDSEGAAGVTCHRHGHRSRTLGNIRPAEDRGAARPAGYAGRQDNGVEEPGAAGPISAVRRRPTR